MKPLYLYHSQYIMVVCGKCFSMSFLGGGVGGVTRSTRWRGLEDSGFRPKACDLGRKALGLWEFKAKAPV